MAVNFCSREFLLGHIRHTLSFYDQYGLDPTGGFFHCFKNDGRVYDPSTRTLVASCRYVFNYAKAFKQFSDPEHLSRMQHGLNFLRSQHRNPTTGAYAWRLYDGQPVDTTNHCYGLAFVMLAYACALDAGYEPARAWLDETYDLMEKHFWLPEHGLYACEATEDWVINPYRGQNDNMHACEAMITAYEASGDKRFLERANTLAETIVLRQGELTGGIIWEHFKQDWSPDLEYNRHDKTNNIRPWGVQTGHQTEWAKLLLILDRHIPEKWHLNKACALFDSAMEFGWDAEFGGLIYGYDLTGTPCDQDKYFWVQAESFAAAALLAHRTGNEKYWHWYRKIWQYSFDNLVDHQFGAWYRVLSRENKKYDDRKSYNNKVDYHTMGACYEVLNVIKS